MDRVEKTVGSVSETADTVGNAAKSVGRAGGRPARDMMYMSLKGAAIALRGTSLVCGKCADGLEATAAIARGAAGAASAGVVSDSRSDATIVDPITPGATPASIDINTATLADLQLIACIDDVRARDIIAAREDEPFETLEQLSRISGLGEKRIGEIKAEGVAVVG